MNISIIDSHAHLGWDSFKEDQAEVIKRAKESGVCQIVQAGVDFAGTESMLKLAENHDWIFNGVGLHPHEAKHWSCDSADFIRQTCKHPSIVAIGECGLDFYYEHSDKESQIRVFIEQVRLALELNKPLIIHTRDAWPETFEILRKEGGGQLKGVFHCFTGGPEHLDQINDLDFYVSFSGILTFKNAQNIQAAARLIKPERYLVETDCPYLAPEGKRGKRNEPSFIWLTAKKLAELRGITLELVAGESSNNARRLFSLPQLQ